MRGWRFAGSLAVGLLLAYVAFALIARLNEPDAGAGWYMYTPSSADYDAELRYEGDAGGSHGLRDTIIYLIAATVWIAVSWRLLRSRREN